MSARNGSSVQARLAATVCLVLGLTAAAQADEFVLTNGGRLQGTWLNRDQRPLKHYDVQTVTGARVRLRADQVARVVRQRPDEAEYRRLAPTFADTVDGQWQLAEWCREHYLNRQRTVHLKRVLELDPDHSRARAALGYSMVAGQWVTTRQWRIDNGYQYYRGRWRLAQEIELLERRRQNELATRRFAATLRRWRDDLPKTDPEAARQALLAVDDPLAVGPMIALARQEPLRDVRLLYAEALAAIGSKEAIAALVAGSLDDGDEEVRLECLDLVAALERPEIAKQYVAALADENNLRVNRAAIALAELGDASAIGPLIDALVTTHQLTFTAPSAASPDAMSATFTMPGHGSSSGVGTPGGTGFSVGPRSETIRRRLANQDVLSALVVLTDGINFSFDQTAWRFWHNAHRQAEQRRESTLQTPRRD